MDLVNKLPADLRAEITLKQTLRQYLDKIENAVSSKDIVEAILHYLPPGLAHRTELRLRLYMLTNTNITAIKSQAKEITLAIIAQSISASTYYTREDVLLWYRDNTTDYFIAPEDEIITITINDGNDHMPKTKAREVKLTQDQLVGIAYGLTALQSNRVQLESSLTKGTLDIVSIIKTAPLYFQTIELALDKLKRPYTVEIVDSNNFWQTIHFTNAEFMQGLASVAQWHGLSNNGKDIIWKNLTQFTREGLIPLQF